jgi:hypothetical protein
VATQGLEAWRGVHSLSLYQGSDTYSHITTSADKFYFNKPLDIDGDLTSYGTGGYSLKKTVGETSYVGGSFQTGTGDWTGFYATNGTVISTLRVTDAGSYGVHMGFVGTDTNHAFVIRANAQPVVYFAPGGSVGINAPSPSLGKLQIAGAYANTGPMERLPDLSLQNTDGTAGNYSSVSNFNSSGNISSAIEFINVDHGYQGAVRFATRNSAGDYAGRMYIDQYGKVGTGTASPNDLAHLYASSGRVAIRTEANNGAGSFRSYSFGTNTTDYNLHIRDDSGDVELLTGSYATGGITIPQELIVLTGALGSSLPFFL